jgi:hypothetical protein
MQGYVVGVMYSGLSGLWLVLMVVVLVNFCTHRRYAKSTQYLIILNVLTKFFHCVFMTMAVLFQMEYYDLSACSAFTIFATTELTMFLVISKGYFISNQLGTKESLQQVAFMAVTYMLYCGYIIFPYYISYVLSLYLSFIYVKVSRESTKSLEILEFIRERVENRVPQQRIDLIQRHKHKILSLEVKFFYFFYHLFLVISFNFLDNTYTSFWILVLFTFELSAFILNFLIVGQFRLSDEDRWTLSFLDDINLNARPVILQAAINRNLVNPPGNIGLIIYPGHNPIYLATLITEPVIYI